jgi:hypothetical protein
MSNEFPFSAVELLREPHSVLKIPEINQELDNRREFVFYAQHMVSFFNSPPELSINLMDGMAQSGCPAMQSSDDSMNRGLIEWRCFNKAKALVCLERQTSKKWLRYLVFRKNVSKC